MSRIHNTVCEKCLFFKGSYGNGAGTGVHAIALAIFESHIRIQNTVCNQCRGSGPIGYISFGPFGSGPVPKCHKTVSNKYLFFAKAPTGSEPDPNQNMSQTHNTVRNKGLFLRRLLRERSQDAGPFLLQLAMSISIMLYSVKMLGIF
jgi:hypothetical protein